MMKKQRRFKNSKFYFGDCAICEFMQEVDQRKKQHTLPELQKAFKKQEKQALVSSIQNTSN